MASQRISRSFQIFCRQSITLLRPVLQGAVKTRARAAAWGHSTEGRQGDAIARSCAAAAVCATA
eukprot:3332628-Pleurochrysis_carterae.AAC.2